MCGKYVDPTDVSGFLDQNHHYKSLATQIPHDTALPPIPSIDRKMFLPLEIEPVLQTVVYKAVCFKQLDYGSMTIIIIIIIYNVSKQLVECKVCQATTYLTLTCRWKSIVQPV